MRTYLPTFLLCCIVFLFFVSSTTLAQYNLDEYPDNPTCDLCGGCRDAEYLRTGPSGSGKLLTPADWKSCRYCIYGETSATLGTKRPQPKKSWAIIGCIDVDQSNPGGFVRVILRFVTGIIGGLAFLGILAGGFQLLTAAGDPIRIASGKNTVMGAGGALLLVVFSVFLLQFIGLNLLGIPGFGG